LQWAFGVTTSSAMWSAFIVMALALAAPGQIAVAPLAEPFCISSVKLSWSRPTGNVSHYLVAAVPACGAAVAIDVSSICICD
jgi:hypothetical protein